MTWTLAPLYAVTALYALQAGLSVYRGDAPNLLILTGYVVANIGLIWNMSK